MAASGLNCDINSDPNLDSDKEDESKGRAAQTDTDIGLSDNEIERTYDTMFRDQRERKRVRQRGYERKYCRRKRIEAELRRGTVGRMEREYYAARRSVNALLDQHERGLVDHPITFQMHVMSLEESTARLIGSQTRTLELAERGRWSNAMIGRMTGIISDLRELQQRLDYLFVIYQL